jgi:hypothetical protein
MIWTGFIMAGVMYGRYQLDILFFCAFQRKSPLFSLQHNFFASVMRSRPNALNQRVHFGWRSAPTECPKPLEYQMTLSMEDFKQPFKMNDPQPNTILVKNIIKQLDGLANTRFVLLTGSLELLKTPENVRRFHENLMQAIYQQAKQEAPQLVPGEGHELLCQLIKGYGPTTAMHWDFKQWPILSLSYQHSPKLEGFYPLLADSSQLFEDLKHTSEGQTFIQGIPDTPDKPDMMLKPNRSKLETDYKVAIPLPKQSTDIPILILNNQRRSGIMHGTMRPDTTESLLKERFENDRTLYQIALSSSDFPSHKYASLKFHEHQRIPLNLSIAV